MNLMLSEREAELRDFGPPLIFGEILFDIFLQGEKILGGAPFNVAVHLQRFELGPIVISRVGRDESGKEILASMRQLGVSSKAVQVDDQKPTGEVKVQLEAHEPTFDILPDRAYDYIGFSEIPEGVLDGARSLLYAGTLALRGSASRNTFARLFRELRPNLFLDLNLRKPWYDPEVIDLQLSRARWVKLNNEELHELAQLFWTQSGSVEKLARVLLERYQLTSVLVTCGNEGAFCVTSDSVHYEPSETVRLVDSVGAGDAFASVVIEGLIRERDWVDILPKATRFAEVICGFPGAITSNLDLYEGFYRRFPQWDWREQST
jgi:fructokinase